MEINGEDIEAPRYIGFSMKIFILQMIKGRSQQILQMGLETLQWSRGDQPSFVILYTRQRSMQLLVVLSRREEDLIYCSVTFP